MRQGHAVVIAAPARSAGLALIAVLVALTLLLLLAIPFSVSMSHGADVATRAIELEKAQLLSASARDLLLADAALGHSSYDETPDCDDRGEFASALPEAFPQLRQEGRARFGGEVWDLQRFVALDAVTPLLFANLIGTTARLQRPLAPDDESIALDSAQNLPEQGLVWIDHEVVRYGSKQGNVLTQLERGQFTEQGFLLPKDHTVSETALALDWRCVLATTWPFDGRTHGNRAERVPFTAASELAEIELAGCGGFTPTELDALAAALAPMADVPTAPIWGRPERVFLDVRPPSRTLVVKSALHLGAGSTVRIRNQKTGAFEYGLVMATQTTRNQPELLLPSVFALDLLHPVLQEYPAIDTVVEPLVPAPVNVNTADAKVIAALIAGCRRGMDVRLHDASGQRRVAPAQPFSVAEARELADAIVEQRQEQPFLGFQEFAQRIWKPRLQDAGQESKLRLLYLYRLLLTGRDSIVEMGTAPIAFRSGSLVGYRAAAAIQRSVVAPAIAARHERTGIAVAAPGLLLRSRWQNQEQIEEAFRLDQRAPFWLTSPVNLGATGAGETGNDPASRYFAHVVAMAFPDAGLGETRFASRDEAAAAITPGPSAVSPGTWGQNGERRGHEAFATAIDPRGHDIAQKGPFQIRNTGPRDESGTATTSSTHELTFPFTVAQSRGGAGRFAISSWFVPDSLANAPLLDYGTGVDDRNRMVLLVRDGNLVFEVLDEAGLDPNPAQSRAGVDRTASQWTLPLAELSLPPRTPVHIAVSAFAGRPNDLSVFVDGMVRGKVRHRSVLTNTIPGFDPSQVPPGPPNEGNSPRNLLVSVEDAESFPDMGVVRIGTELFEYIGKSGNDLVCKFDDSRGGRGVRQSPREHRPDIKVDQNGDPVVNIEQLAAGTNLDQFPDHPVGSTVELYGYSVEPQANRVLMPGETRLSTTVGGFAVARGWIPNGRPIGIPVQNGTLTIGTGIDVNWTGNLELADPVVTAGAVPSPAQAKIQETFQADGGYALLVQAGFKFDPNVPGQVSGASVFVGGIEVIRYQSRQGNRLMNVTRAAPLPGDDSQIDRAWYDGTAHNFIVNWAVSDGRTSFNDSPAWLLNVVPISLAVQSTQSLADPADTGTVEWAQLFPNGGDENDTEWVRYDVLLERRLLVRANRGRWESLRLALTNQTGVNSVQLGPGGASSSQPATTAAPWGTVTPTSGYIGYVPRLEADFPQILAARQSLGFRGDPFTGTSAHPHQNSVVLPCHRFDLQFGNWSAMTGRAGRYDRVALVAGSQASGTKRPPVEWQTVHWQARRYVGDVQPNSSSRTVAEPMSPTAFQLVAFRGPVRDIFRGRVDDTAPVDIRTVDRMCKYPSGELPAASVEAVAAGGGAQGAGQQSGFVDEIDVTEHFVRDLVVDEAFAADAQQLLLKPDAFVEAQGLWYGGNDITAALPAGGGLLQIDDEILAYSQRNDGTVTIARNGRGLLHTEARGHDRGARVHFLTQRPAAILLSSITGRSETMPLQALGAMPPNFGTVLVNRSEIAHYCWVRSSGDNAVLEMPRQFPPGDDGDSTGSRGLFRGRYGTVPVGAGAQEPVILMPFRYWDRHVPRNDDPEQSYFQFTSREAPVYFRSLQWEEEVSDGTVDVVCLVRADERAPWTNEPNKSPFLRLLQRAAADAAPAVLDVQATQLEIRFAVEYKAGCLDLQSFRAHGWKTAPTIRHVDVESEGEGRIVFERVSAR